MTIPNSLEGLRDAIYKTEKAYSSLHEIDTAIQRLGYWLLESDWEIQRLGVETEELDRDLSVIRECSEKMRMVDASLQKMYAELEKLDIRLLYGPPLFDSRED